jgi:hypothetical protein
MIGGTAAGITGATAYAAEWAQGKVVRVDLTEGEGGYTGVATTFLTGLKNPVPVVATSGGGLLVGDWTTGTVYLIRE